MMFGFKLKTTAGYIAFDDSKGPMPQFVGKYSMTQALQVLVASNVYCVGLPKAFIKNIAVPGGSATIVGIRSTGVNLWEIQATGAATASNVLAGELYVFGSKTANKPSSGYGLVIKNSSPGGLDFFDFRDRILLVSGFAQSTASSGNTYTGGVPAITLTTGTIPTNWAVCASFPSGGLIRQVTSSAALEYATGVGKVSATSCTFVGDTIFSLGAVFPPSARGGYTTDNGYFAYFIDTDMYK